jgi:phosphoglycerate kinase
MSFSKQTIKDINFEGKTVLLRADYNVPLSSTGKITDDYRILQSLPTVKYLLSKHVKLIICSHLGRPKGPHDLKYSLRVVADKLRKVLEPHHVAFVNECTGPEVEKAVKNLKTGQILLLENLRFHPEEEENNPEFAKSLAILAEIFVQDGFGVVHRAHASTDAITKFIPSVSGLLLEKEVDTITNVLESPKRPLAAIIGGAKISDKIQLINKFIEIADFVAIGGAMANTFLKASNIDIAHSVYDKGEIGLAKDIMEKARQKSRESSFSFFLPKDAVVSKKINSNSHTRIVDWSSHIVADIESYPKNPDAKDYRIEKDEQILDIGPFSAAFIAGSLQLSKTVIWNGTMGVTEVEGLHGPIGPFARGSEILVDGILGEFGNRPFSLVGGGDTVGYIENRNLVDSFDHVSTGGGASLELMAGRKLPGVEALLDKKEKARI